jgi:HD superfamily phosphohydrolase
VLFENGEFAHSGERIIRVGTHTGDNQLFSRINQHFVLENKDRSIFRKNIGRALLNKSNDIYLEKWELDLTTKGAKSKYQNIIEIEKQKEIEKEVTKYIQECFRFIVFEIDNKDTRLSLESKIISTVSLCNECKQSEKWLGNYSPVEKIKKSGLWLVNELWKTPLNDDDINCIKIIEIGQMHITGG